jgi:16S rRNA (cytosine967-C5)-methyltransferase
MKHFSHLNTAVELIEQYKREAPFSIFLRAFFTQHKKYGSRDRKTIANCCYCYFRLGHALETFPIEEKILIGLFLCDQQQSELLQHFKPNWNPQLSVDEKISILNNENIPFAIEDIFPWKQLLSEGIDHAQFCRSFLIQPDLFLRLRPGHESTVKNKLRTAGVGFTELSASCLALPNTSKIDTIIALDREAVVQDLNSQHTLGGEATPRRSESVEGPAEASPEPSQRVEALAHARPERSGRPVSVWDCCAASGGKSILAYDLIPNIKLTVSDIRESIIHNLKKRLANAGIQNYHSFVADLTTSNLQLPTSNKFDVIICDAPCSGSGTWSRTPEQLVFFDAASSIDHYSSLQQKITTNVIPHLKPGGKLIYITCSVFKKENEDAVNYITDNFSLKLEKMEILKGFDKKADTLFAASFSSVI